MHFFPRYLHAPAHHHGQHLAVPSRSPIRERSRERSFVAEGTEKGTMSPSLQKLNSALGKKERKKIIIFVQIFFGNFLF